MTSRTVTALAWPAQAERPPCGVQTGPEPPGATSSTSATDLAHAYALAEPP